jgi:hypothetical protein
VVKREKREMASTSLNEHLMHLFHTQNMRGDEFGSVVLASCMESGSYGLGSTLPEDGIRVGEFVVGHAQIVQALRSSIMSLEEELHRYGVCLV